MKTIEEKLAKMFYDRRKELGLTYKQVAKLGEENGGGFDYQTVFRLEKGRLRLRPSVLKKIAKVLDFEIPEELIPKMEPLSICSSPTTSLGRFLREKRLELEETQVEFAAKLGVSSAIVSGLESGKYKAGRKALLKITGALGVEKVPE